MSSLKKKIKTGGSFGDKMVGEDLIDKVSGYFGTGLKWVVIVIIILFVLAIFGGVAYWARKRKKWNLIVGFRLPRSDGRIVNYERGKGFYDTKNGFVSLKRKKLSPIDMKPFSVTKYLQGGNYLEVLQVAPDDFIPILPQSYRIITKSNAKEGEQKKFALLNIEGDMLERKQWAIHAVESALNRFTLKGFLKRHELAVTISIIMFSLFIGFAILWSRMPKA